MNDSAEYKWHVELVQDRYQYLSLSYAQAEQIYLHEQNMGTHSGTHYFSPWEEWNYEQTVFQDILNHDQFSIYKERLDNSIKMHDDGLADYDSKDTTAINYYSEIITHYEENFLPQIVNYLSLQHSELLKEIRPKIQYLKAEYGKFLAEYRREIIISHIRYYKSLCPNKLKAHLLGHKLLYLLPDVFSFKGKMDEPTKNVFMFVKEKMYLIPDDVYKSWKERLQELATFNKSMSRKHYPEPTPWFFYGQLPAEEEKKEEIISLLLLDKDKYGWNPALLR